MVEEPSRERLSEAFDNQVAFSIGMGPEEHEEYGDNGFAIAWGRSAGLAKQAGFDNIATAYWQKLTNSTGVVVPGAPEIPSLEELYTGYQENLASGRFDRFALAEVYPATPGLAFSNALGSAAQLINFVRTNAGLSKGQALPYDPVHVIEGGVAALQAMGQERSASRFKELAQKIGQPDRGTHGAGM